MEQPDPENHFQAGHAHLLLSSYRHWTGEELLPPGDDPAILARTLYESPFVVLSHGTEADPVLNYANRTGLALFELDWKELTRMPSRLTAEPQIREERARLMERVTRHGFIDDYSGIRISKSGKRFHITRATVWNLIGKDDVYRGQAATFSDWREIKSKPASDRVTRFS